MKFPSLALVCALSLATWRGAGRGRGGTCKMRRQMKGSSSSSLLLSSLELSDTKVYEP